MNRSAHVIRNAMPEKQVRNGVINNFIVPKSAVDGIIQAATPEGGYATPNPTLGRAWRAKTENTNGVRRIAGEVDHIT